MNVIAILKEIFHLTNKYELSLDEKETLKNNLCYLSEWRKNNRDEAKNYPSLDFALYNASLKLRTFGYNYLNSLKNENVNLGDDLILIKDSAIEKIYETHIGGTLDKDQKEVIDIFEESEGRLFLSAPTSFGKTFLLKEIIYKHFNEYLNIVVVLPTVALLIENTRELDKFNEKFDLGYSIYNSVYKDINITDRNIFVLTPERVLRLLSIAPDLKIDFFFFDEIYKIDEDSTIDHEVENNENIKDDKNFHRNGNSNRSIAFRLALYFLLRKCPHCYLAGPYIEISKLGDGFRNMLLKHNIASKEISFSRTLENLISFGQNSIQYSSPFGKHTEICHCKSSFDKLVYVAEKLNFSKQNQAIVYCLYPAYSGKYALKFGNTIENGKTAISENLELFINHLANNYDFKVKGLSTIDEWDFYKSLKSKIGIHNGRFPKYFQKEILQLFNDKAINTLFCTSTIVEGVNTNAKTVVILNNPSGRTDESKKFLLLNIKGRAGRYMHHFVGYVVLIGNKTNDILKNGSIALNFKPYSSSESLGDLDLENIDSKDLSVENRKKQASISLNKTLLPDNVFAQNRLIERKKQEKILSILVDSAKSLVGIEKASARDFIKKNYLDKILEIYADVEGIKKEAVQARKYFAKNYAENGYFGVLQYQFNRGLIEGSVNKTYQTVFHNVRNLVEFELPKILCLFESLISRAFEINNIELSKPLDFSEIIRFFEIGAQTPLGIDMAEKGVPVIAARKLDHIKFQSNNLESQKAEFSINFDKYEYLFDEYEKRYLQEYIKVYCIDN